MCPSMGLAEDGSEDAICERIFPTLVECEFLGSGQFEAQSDAHIAVFEFIEVWCNRHCRHSAVTEPAQYARR